MFITRYRAIMVGNGYQIFLYDTPRCKKFKIMKCATFSDAIAVCRVLNGEAA